MSSAKTPLVSVIIIFLNGELYLAEAIQSVLAQTYSHWELLLVDDGSSDGSSAIARQYAQQMPQKIGCLEHAGHRNRGMSASRNLGIDHAHGKYVGFLDADDIWLPDKLTHQVHILNDNPEAGMVYGNTLYWYRWTDQPGAEQKDFYPDLGVAVNKQHAPPELVTGFLNGQAAVPCTCSILVRRDAIKQVMGFEESFHSMYEDQAFYAKICLSYPVFVSSECHDRYRQHTASTVTKATAAGLEQEARWRFLVWLEAYILSAGVKNKPLQRTLRKEKWLLAQPAWLPLASPRGRHIIRYVKKWLLRFESWLAPDALRNWWWDRV